MSNALIALGANLGDRAATLDAAIEKLERSPGISSVRASTWLQTDPIGGPGGQQPFLNGAAILETSLSAETLHKLLHRIETELGRERRIRWDSRAIDLDLLLFDDAVVETEQLMLPHPRMAFRRFVLAPAAQVAGDMIHPLVEMSVGELLANINQKPHHLTIVGEQPARQFFLQQVVSRLETPLTVHWKELDPDRLDHTPSEPPTLLVLLDSFTSIPPGYRCPILRLSASDRDNAVSELIAAVEAMQ